MVDRQAWVLGAATIGAWLLPGDAAARRVVFVNLDPVVLVDTAGQDPTQNSFTSTGFAPGPASGWPALTEEQRTELLYWLKEASVPFDIIYTFDRPAVGTSYDMVVTGTAADNAALFPGFGCSTAIGLSDCNDANAENVSFLFWGCMNMADQADMHRVAFNTFAGLGFGWGLENLTGTGQIMAGYSINSLEFGNVCTTLSGAQNCVGGHPGCADPQQNSTADLNARIGARVDDGPPTVTITSPADDAVVEPDLTVEAAVGDLFGGLTVELEIVEAGATQLDERPPYRWTLVGIPQGTWTLRVTATDADANVTSQEITVCVDVPACGEDPVEDSTGADASTGDGTSTGDGWVTGVVLETSSGDDGEPEPEPPATTGAPPAATSFGGDSPETGCQCRTARDQGGPVPGLLALLLLGALTRRE